MRNIAGLKPTNKVFGYILGALFVIAAVAALLGGCGTDEITGGNGNPPVSTGDSLIYKLDSFALYSNGLNTNDTTLFNVFNIGDSIKVTFAAETNCAMSDTAFISGAIGNISFTLSKTDLPNSFTYYGGFQMSNSVSLLLYLKTTSMRYLRIKNAHFYRINPV